MRYLLTLFLFLTAPAWAQPAQYVLDLEKSSVDFIYDLQGTSVTGSLPLASADMKIDVMDITRSVVTVTHNAGQATGGLPFATPILRGAEMLDAAAHPQIRFESTSITGRLPRGVVTGTLTIKGVTRPITLQAELFRQPNTDPNDLTKLAVQLTGSLNRHDFNISGYPGFVGPEIKLRIMSWISRQ